MRFRSAVGCMVVAVGLAAAPAHAHLVGHTDPDDVDSRLDVRRATVQRSEGTLVVRARTFERIRDRDLLDGGFLVSFDSRAGRAADFFLRMELYEGGRPWCRLSDSDGFSRYETEATRTRRSFTCEFARAELEPKKHLRWRVRTGEGETRESAPDAGWYRH